MTAEIKHKNPDAIKKVYESMASKTERVVAVGFPAGKCQAYPDGTEVAAVAAFHVYGMGVPRRDFMGLARDEIIQKAVPILRALPTAENEKTQEVIREAAGQEAVNAIKRAIVDLDTPPNAPGTLHPSVGGTNKHGKKSTNPLINTGHMLQSVTYVVRDKE